jgi:fumarate reductase subunit C
MNENMSMEMAYNHESLISRWWKSRDFLQKRMLRMCLSILVMVLCFPLYYLGFFGTVEGPLNPAHMGDMLANMGVTRTHSMVLFLTFMIIAVSWNWIYNLVSLLIGSRLACSRTGFQGKSCGAKVVRKRILDITTGKKTYQYVCAKGHKRNDAHFHPIKKGTISHSIWLISVAFCVIVFFMS